LQPDTSYSWIPVLAALQAVEHGTQLPLARCLVFFEAVRFARQVSYASRETCTTPRGEYAPAQEPVGVLEARVLFPAFEKALQKRVQCFCLLQRYPQFDGGLSVQASGLSPGRFCPA
jgi:hypothetical protein